MNSSAFASVTARLKNAIVWAITVAITSIAVTSTGFAQDIVRSWQSAAGSHSTYGELVKHDKDSITIKTAKDKLITVPLAKLSDVDQRFIGGLDIIKKDREQFDLIQPHLQRYQESPAAVVEILEEIHRQNSDSPYAAMMVGVAYASEAADYKKATRYFREANKSVDAAQKTIGKGYQFQTEMTLNNNLALCSLKARKGDAAARYLLSGAQSEKIPFVVYHNATILMDVTRGGGSIRFGDKYRKQLVGLIAKKAPQSPGVPVPKRYMYTLAWDEPITVRNLERLCANPNEPLNTAEGKSTNISGAVFQAKNN